MKKTRRSKVRSNKTHKKYLGGSPNSSINNKFISHLQYTLKARKGRSPTKEELDEYIAQKNQELQDWRDPEKGPQMRENNGKYLEERQKQLQKDYEQSENERRERKEREKRADQERQRANAEKLKDLEEKLKNQAIKEEKARIKREKEFEKTNKEVKELFARLNEEAIKRQEVQDAEAAASAERDRKFKESMEKAREEYEKNKTNVDSLPITPPPSPLDNDEVLRQQEEVLRQKQERDKAKYEEIIKWENALEERVNSNIKRDAANKIQNFVKSQKKKSQKAQKKNTATPSH